MTLARVLRTISAPTLGLHTVGDLLVSVEQGRESAELVPGARYVELPGTDHLPFFEDPETSLGLIEEFVTGERYGVATDRVLVTVVFNDIVSSTALASQLGDHVWKQTLETYRHRGTRSGTVQGPIDQDHRRRDPHDL
jgi:hypothetical protein